MSSTTNFNPSRLIVVTGLLTSGKSVVMAVLDKLSVFHYPKFQDYTFHYMNTGRINETAEAVIQSLSSRILKYSVPQPVFGVSRLNNEGEKLFFDKKTLQGVLIELEKQQWSNIQQAWFEFYRQTSSAFIDRQTLHLNSDTIAIMPRKIEPDIASFEFTLLSYKKYFSDVRYILLIREELNWINARMLNGYLREHKVFDSRDLIEYREYRELFQKWAHRNDTCVIELESFFESPTKTIANLADFVGTTVPELSEFSTFNSAGVETDWNTLFSSGDDKYKYISKSVLKHILCFRRMTSSWKLLYPLTNAISVQLLNILFRLGYRRFHKQCQNQEIVKAS